MNRAIDERTATCIEEIERVAWFARAALGAIWLEHLPQQVPARSTAQAAEGSKRPRRRFGA